MEPTTAAVAAGGALLGIALGILIWNLYLSSRGRSLRGLTDTAGREAASIRDAARREADQLRQSAAEEAAR
ncbi:MAG TPA: hypothetical protein PLL69_10470, partial [Gemmatimonadales bacterium]|nr:hypothetical protein [Gemmatimonadales bacterium]